jgi:hypothetical protein
MRGLVVFLLAAAIATPSAAATGQAQPTAETNDEIVVTARRSGAPMWTIQTQTGVVILVGEIAGVPKATPWRPERLEGATDVRSASSWAPRRRCRRATYCG